jgi:moderate conductance mechanosensitive channel
VLGVSSLSILAQRNTGPCDDAGAICRFLAERLGPIGPTVAETGEDVLIALGKALVILALAWVASRVLRRLIKRFIRGLATKGLERLGRLSEKAPLSGTAPIDLSRMQMRTETLVAVLSSITSFVVWGIAIVTILGSIGIELGPLIASAGIAGVALGFGAQNLVKDFLSGMFILMEDQYGIGDVVDLRDSIGTPGANGTVEGISLRTTRLRDVEGVVWHVPNGEIRTAGNKSQQWARSLLDVSVAYDTDVQQACALLKQVADELWQDPEFGPDIIDEPEVWGLERIGPSELVLRMVIKVQPARQWAVNRELRVRIKRAFDDAGIEIPFPQHTVWLRESKAPATTE